MGRVYGEMEEDDHDKMLWNNVDLDDPKELVNYLFMKAVHQNHTTEFMNTLVALCSIPNSKSGLWTSLPKLIMSVTGKSAEYNQISSNEAAPVSLQSISEESSSSHYDTMYEDINKLKLFLD